MHGLGHCTGTAAQGACVLHSASALSSVVSSSPQGRPNKSEQLGKWEIAVKMKRNKEKRTTMWIIHTQRLLKHIMIHSLLLQRVGYSGENMIISWSTLLAEDIPLFISCCQQGAIIAIHEETWGQERGVEDMQLAGQGFVAHSPNGQPGHPETVVSRVVSCCLGWVGRQQFYTERTSPKL